MGKSVIAITVAAVTAASSAGASAAELHECRRGADVRTLEVLTPGEVGAACDLKYVRSAGADVSVPYHADNSSEFCAERARILIRSLEDAGYDCVAATSIGEAPELRADAGQAVAVEETPAALAGELENRVAIEIPAAPPEVADTIVAAEETLALEQPGELQAPGVETASLPEAARSGPVALTTTPASQSAPAEISSGSAVGRITGADPGEAAAPTIVASAEKPAPLKPRSPEEIIRSVLLAQAAAWNDADLDAYMNTFWKSGEFRLIADGKVAKGWKDAVEYYKSRFGEGADFGRLSRDGLEIEMVSDDVAVASGRYTLLRAGGAEAGSVTLVIKRVDGLWRIVHQHTTADSAPAE